MSLTTTFAGQSVRRAPSSPFVQFLLIQVDLPAQVRAIPVRRQARRIVTAVKAEHQQAASRRAVAFAVPGKPDTDQCIHFFSLTSSTYKLLLAALAAAMLMMSAPVEAKIQGGKASSSTESSQSGYDMTGKLCSLLCCS